MDRSHHSFRVGIPRPTASESPSVTPSTLVEQGLMTHSDSRDPDSLRVLVSPLNFTYVNHLFTGPGAGRAVSYGPGGGRHPSFEHLRRDIGWQPQYGEYLCRGRNRTSPTRLVLPPAPTRPDHVPCEPVARSTGYGPFNTPPLGHYSAPVRSPPCLRRPGPRSRSVHP